MRLLFKGAILAFAILVFAIAPAWAQAPSSADIQYYAKSVSQNCIGNWESADCLSASSTITLTLAALYSSKLQESGHSQAAENIKQHCAAATAARQKEFPSYAMQSAFTECANTMYDTSVETKVEPQPELYQLLVSSVLCLSKDGRCAVVEQGLQPYAER